MVPRGGIALLWRIETPVMIFGHKLRQLRTRAGHSQQQLALTLGITQSYLSHLEQGRRVPSPDLVERLGEALNLDDTDILKLRLLAEESGGREDRQPPQLRPESVEDERNRQRDVSEVWVVAKSPLESYDEAYRRLVVDGISSKENPRKYIYWTSLPENFDAMFGKLSLDLAVKLKRDNDDRNPQDILSRMVVCVAVPDPAVWFSFVIYNPTIPYTRPRAYLSLEAAASHTGYVVNMSDSGALDRAVEDLRRAILALSVESSANATYRERGWRLHFPKNPRDSQ